MTNYEFSTGVDDWEEKYRPIANHIDRHASWATEQGEGTGIMFETYGDELKFVSAQPASNVWTYVDTPDGGTSIVAGFHTANRIGYFVTEVPRTPAEDNSSIRVTFGNEYSYGLGE